MILLPMTLPPTLSYLTNLKIRGLVDTYKWFSCGSIENMVWQHWAVAQWVTMSDKGIWTLHPILNSSSYQKGLKDSVLILKLRFTRSQERQAVLINVHFCKFNLQVQFLWPLWCFRLLYSSRNTMQEKEAYQWRKTYIACEKILMGNYKTILFHCWVYIIFFQYFQLRIFTLLKTKQGGKNLFILTSEIC